MGSSLILSVQTVLVAHFSLDAAPFATAVAWRVGALLGTMSLAASVWPRAFFDRRLWSCWAAMHRRPAFYLAVLGPLDFPLFALAGRFLDIGVVSVLFQASSLFFVLLLWASHRGRGIYSDRSVLTLLFGAAVLCGAVLAVMSDGGVSGPALGWALAGGVGVSLAGALVGALNSLGVRLSREVAEAGEGRWPVLVCLLVGAGIVNAVNLPVVAVLWQVSGQDLPWLLMPLIACLAFLLYPASGLMWRTAALVGRSVWVNSLSASYAPMGLVWLFLAGYGLVERPGLLFVGCGLVTLSVAGFTVRGAGPAPRV